MLCDLYVYIWPFFRLVFGMVYMVKPCISDIVLCDCLPLFLYLHILFSDDFLCVPFMLDMNVNDEYLSALNAFKGGVRCVVCVLPVSLRLNIGLFYVVAVRALNVAADKMNLSFENKFLVLNGDALLAFGIVNLLIDPFVLDPAGWTI